MNQKLKDNLILTAKVAVSAALLYFLLTKIDLENFIVAGREFPMWTIAPLTLLFIVTIFFGSWRWKVFLRAHGIEQGILKGIELYMVGYFFNNFLPSGVGGDVVRGYSAGKNCGKMKEVFASIVAERFSGLLASLVSALAFLPIVKPPSPIPMLVIGLNLVFWGGTVLFVFLNLEGFLRKILGKLPSGLGHKIADFVEALRFYRKDVPALVKGFILSVVYQGVLVAFVYLIAVIAGVSEIPWTAYFVFVSLIWIISLIPISLNALGVREASFSYFFAMWGASEAKGLLVSLIFFGISIICGVIGGVIWVLSGHRDKRGEMFGSETVK